MGMFDTTGRADIVETRSEHPLRKLERMSKALRHEEPDRVPISDFFWVRMSTVMRMTIRSMLFSFQGSVHVWDFSQPVI